MNSIALNYRWNLVLVACLSLLFVQTRVASGAPPSARVTFSEHIAPIVFNNCTGCHRPDEAAPFSFMNYRDIQKRGRLIRRVTKSRYMPPWHPEPGHGEFQDSRRLTDEQVSLIAEWVDTGMELGDEKKIPALPKFTDGWQLGEPDLVVTMERTFSVPKDGPDIYRNFVVPLDIPEDKWVTAVELRPSARTVVHHSLFYLDDSGTARKLDGQDGTPGFRGMGFRRSGSLGGWAVGATPRFLPEGLARPLGKGSDLVLSTHFHPSGKAEEEKTTVGIFFADKPPSRKLLGFQLPPVFGRLAGLDIPAGEKDFKIKGTFTVPVDITLMSVGGHAHYICQTMKAWATLPDGSTKRLFSITDWDFNWQGRYEYKEPVNLPRGTVIDAELTYNNSEDNPHNPNNPPKHIRWGLQSTDEMGSVIFSAVAAREEDADQLQRSIRQQIATGSVTGGSGSRGGGRRGLGGLLDGLAGRLRALDKNGDGKIDSSEIPRQFRNYLNRLDTNGDGVIDEEEIKALDGGRDR